nr:hypothetical protein [Candidatus Sigynarchaeota archaeon]
MAQNLENSMPARRGTGTTIRDLVPWCSSAFLEHLPMASLVFIAIPVVAFGMFTMGLNPEDSPMKNGYYLLVLVVPVISLLAGSVLAFIRWHEAIHVIVSVCIGIVAFLCYLWFYAKISIVPLELQSEFEGWHWKERYQFWLFLALVVLMATRCGMTFKRLRSSGNLADHQGSVLSSNRAGGLAIAGLVIATQYGASWLTGAWYSLLLIQACIDMAVAAWTVLVTDWNKLRSTETQSIVKREPERPLPLLIIPIPFLLLPHGFNMGLAFTANSWTTTWLASFAWIFGTAAISVLLLWFLQKRYSDKSLVPWLLFGSSALLIAMELAFEQRWLVPMDLLFWIVTGIAGGMFILAIVTILAPVDHPFHTTLHVLVAIFIVTVGTGGGIAYYLYEPYGSTIIIWIIIGCKIIAVFTCGVCVIASVAKGMKKTKIEVAA